MILLKLLEIYTRVLLFIIYAFFLQLYNHYKYFILMKNFRGWAQKNSATRKLMETVDTLLKKRQFSSIYSEEINIKIKDNIKTWQEDEGIIESEIYNYVELYLIKWAVELYVDPKNETNLGQVLSIIQQFGYKVTQPTKNLLNGFNKKLKTLEIILNRWKYEQKNGIMNEIQLSTSQLSERDLEPFWRAQRILICDANKAFTKINDTMEQNIQYKKDIDVLSKQIENFKKNQYELLQSSSQKESIQMLKMSHEEQLLKLSQKLELALTNLQSKTQQSEGKNYELQEAKKDFQKQIRVKIETLQMLEGQKRSAESECERLSQQKMQYNKNNQIKKLLAIDAEKNTQIQKYQVKLSVLQKQNQESIQKLKVNFDAKLKESAKVVQEANQKMKDIKLKLRQKDQCIGQLIQKCQLCQKQSKDLRIELTQQQNQHVKLNLHVQELKDSLIIQENKLKVCSPYDKLFSHQIFFNNLRGKEFIANVLNQRYKQTVINSKLLCRLDPLNKVNFHKYIDNIPHVLALAELENGKIVAGFSLSAWEPRVKGIDSIIFSVTNQEVFYPRASTKQCIIHDDYFLIIGNSEFRLKTGQAKAFSNIGVNNGYFDHQNHTVDILFGEGKTRDVDILRYELFQVFFDGEITFEAK